MAVAGGTVPAFLLHISGGQLVVGNTQMVKKEMTEDNPADAVEKMRRGESVYLRAQGLNLAVVRQMLK